MTHVTMFLNAGLYFKYTIPYVWITYPVTLKLKFQTII